jgi:hypothetical protein
MLVLLQQLVLAPCTVRQALQDDAVLCHTPAAAVQGWNHTFVYINISSEEDVTSCMCLSPREAWFIRLSGALNKAAARR